MDGDAIWISEKLQEVPEEFRAEYAWILPLPSIMSLATFIPISDEMKKKCEQFMKEHSK